MPVESVAAFLPQVYRWVFCVGLAILLVAESVAPLISVESERRRIRHVLRNFGLWFLALGLAEGLIGAGLLGIPARALASQGCLSGVAGGTWVGLVLGVLILDFGQFVFHRLTHLHPLFWAVHAVHHADETLDVSTALRFHPVEIALSLVWKVGFVTACGLPLWLLGVRAVLLAPLVMIQHANARIPAAVDRALQWVFVTPALHRTHHSSAVADRDANYGEIFSFWDRLFGTFLSPAAMAPDQYGVAGLQGERWQTVPAMLAMPLYVGAAVLDVSREVLVSRPTTRGRRGLSSTTRLSVRRIV